MYVPMLGAKSLKKTVEKSVLIEILRSLDKKETRRLHKWLLSPAHNQREDVVQLYDYIVKHLDEDSSVLSKEKAWKALFKKEAYDDAQMRQIMHFLLTNLEEFIVFSEIQKDIFTSRSTLLRVYRTRNLNKAFRLTLESNKKVHSQEPYRDSTFFKRRHLIENEELKFDFSSTQRWHTELNLQSLARTLDLSYILDKLRLSCDMLSHQANYQKVSYDLGFTEVIIDYIEANKGEMLNEPAVALYYYAYKARTEKNNELFFSSLLESIFTRGHLLPTEEIRDIYVLALNYCSDKINIGEYTYIKQAFDLYKTGCESGILLFNNMVTKTTFSNTVAYAISLKEFAWLENFIGTFESRLDEKHRKSMTNFSLARLYFEKGEYGKVQKYLLNFEYDDPVMNMIAKTILLKIYFEQGIFDAFESLIESMRSYLQRQEGLSQAHKTLFKNLLSQMKKLLNVNPHARVEVDKFEEGIRNTNPLSDREWFLAQVEKMRRR